MEEEKLISFDELQEHSSADDAWIHIEGIVYNLTALNEVHAEELPDVLEKLFECAGKDATETFHEVSQGQDLLELFQDFKVGIIHQREDEDLGPPKSVDKILGEELIIESLSRLTKTPDGTSFTYTKVNIQGQKLTNVDALETYEYIQYLMLPKNNIADPSVLEKLKYLVVANLSENKIVNFFIQPRKYLKILDLSKNKIGSLISPEGIEFEHSALEQLNLNNNKLQSLQGFASHPNLQILEIRGNKISSLAYLPSLPNLEELYMAGNSIAVLSNLENVPNVRIIHARGNKIETLDDLPINLTTLEKLNIRENQISSVEQIKKLSVFTGLKFLNMKENPVTEVETYRLDVILAIPWLVSLDKQPITQEERDQAKELDEERKAKEEEERLARLEEEEAARLAKEQEELERAQQAEADAENADADADADGEANPDGEANGDADGGQQPDE